jgi:hypothetical protein
MKVLDVKYGIEITRPWNAAMYKHNEEVATQMKRNLEEALNKAEAADDRAALCELAKIVNGYGYSEDFTIGEIWEETLFALDHRVENWWLNREYPYAVKKGFVPAVEKEMIGYSK